MEDVDLDELGTLSRPRGGYAAASIDDQMFDPNAPKVPITTVPSVSIVPEETISTSHQQPDSAPTAPGGSIGTSHQQQDGMPTAPGGSIGTSHQQQDGSLAAPSGDALATADLTDAELPDKHDLVPARADEPGGIKPIGEDDIEAVGWQRDHGEVPIPIIRSLTNEQLWLLIRRFNMQTYHVKTAEGPFPGGLDLNIADEEEFSPDKLRANFERLYMTVIIGMAGFAKHIARLRSWNESRRSAGFCAAYFIAWYSNLLLPLILSTTLLLIAHPPSRSYLFPPAPLAVVSASTGGLQAPKAGALATGDSLTGAPESHQGEAVEAEAANFVSGVASIALTSVSGKGPKNKGDREKVGDGMEESLPDPAALVGGVSEAKDNVDADASSGRDKTKVPVHDAMWTKARPAMRAVADLADAWERFGNALSPTPPFHRYRARMKLAAILVPLVLVTAVTPAALVVKVLGLAQGFVFFGQPIMTRAYHELNARIPDWQKYLDLRNSLMHGVPTNAQLTLTLLRIGEENKWPLPPPPTAHPAETPPVATDEDHHALMADVHPDLAAAHPEPGSTEAQVHPPTDSAPRPDADADESQHQTPTHKKHGSKLIGLMKGTARAGVATVLGVNRVKASVGSDHAKQRLGAVPELPSKKAQKLDQARVEDGPVEYKARLHGKRGRVYITLNAVTPSVSFGVDSVKRKLQEATGLGGGGGAGDGDDDADGEKGSSPQPDPKLSIALSDIRELKKVGGLGWKSKLVVGYALQMETADGLEVTYLDRETRERQTVRFMAMLRRDELFNRLIALGGRKWESW